MAPLMLQGQYMPESHMLPQTWHRQQVSREQVPPIAALPCPAPSNGVPSQHQSWGEAPTFSNNSFTWGSTLPMHPSIVSDPDYHPLRNNDLCYNHMAVQNTMTKDGNEYGGQISWLAPRPNVVPRGVSLNGSDLESNSSLSPKGYLETDSFSPVSFPDQASSSRDWNGYPTSVPSMKESSPKCTSSGPYLVSAPAQTDQGVSKVDFSGFPMMGMGIAMSTIEPAGSNYQGGELGGSPDDNPQIGSEYSCSHGSSPGVSPWYLTPYSPATSGLPSLGRHLHLNDVSDNSSPGSSYSPGNSCARQQTRPWSDNRVCLPAQPKFQDRFQVPRSADAHTERKLNDDLLIQGKKDGLTYKEIRRKMVGDKPAESTLRGRYRSLTKARKDRVRKPVWTKQDIELLDRFVEQELDRIDSTLAYPQALSLDQKLVKVQWKKVAENIDEQGGSYHFGNSTCKRKWLEVNNGS
ncbi:uncharacterized protein K460DRAFT_409048 [Cucurbitaria berberidis CBS 394.84]|uniref:Myb-like domain-containing protein n=1 Tax=Cucurbitaria berberidis CBS 394.84 TaxID=1168544 RepID=A0A9P4G9S1_9PLEO|nr:uncharacterized protein K460DRAFT_409048 [Cucurbitaria berberidis CBS 394.84]KAF1841589.1 hypothetical protein K460DRAFT_409048 [Cucurbitaria berberidis CBS 394.84]